MTSVRHITKMAQKSRVNKYNLRRCVVKLIRLSAEEYRRAWENTLCMGYNIRECRVAVSRLTAQESEKYRNYGNLEPHKKKLMLHDGSVREHVLWIPSRSTVLSMSSSLEPTISTHNFP